MITIKDPDFKCLADEDGSGKYQIDGVIVIAHSMQRAEEIYEAFHADKLDASPPPSEDTLF